MRALAASLSHAPAAIGVLTAPGQMQFTRTPRGPYCTAARRVSATTPPLLAVAPDAGGRRDGHDAAAHLPFGALEVGERVLHREEGAGEVHRERALEGLE